MFRSMLKSKIHRATVTDCDLHYEGSIALDPALMEAADLLEYEKVLVADVDNGARFETYVIRGTEPGQVMLNGAAARRVMKGDRIIVMAFALVPESEAASRKPRVVLLDEANKPVKD